MSTAQFSASPNFGNALAGTSRSLVNAQGFTLSHEQQNAVNQAVEALTSGQNFVISGPAGSGKSSILSEIISRLNNVYVLVPTNKARMVLQNKGVKNVQTAYSFLFVPDIDPETGKLVFIAKSDLDADRYAKLVPPYGHLIIDEASMVKDYVLAEIMAESRRQGSTFLAIGDEYQLPPIYDGGRGGDRYDGLTLLEHADIRLTQVFRQQSGSPVLDHATNVRNGGSIFSVPRGVQRRSASDVSRIADIYLRERWNIIIVGSNDARIRINEQVRWLRGFNGLLCVGDQIVTLENHPTDYVNGEIFTVTNILLEKPRSFIVELTNDVGTIELEVAKKGFGSIDPKKCKVRVDAVLADYAYAITCHKSQGSQWDRCIVCPVGVIPDKIDGYRAWNYTSVTRAQRELAIITSTRKYTSRGSIQTSEANAIQTNLNSLARANPCSTEAYQAVLELKSCVTDALDEYESDIEWAWQHQLSDEQRILLGSQSRQARVTKLSSMYGLCFDAAYATIKNIDTYLAGWLRWRLPLDFILGQLELARLRIEMITHRCVLPAAEQVVREILVTPYERVRNELLQYVSFIREVESLRGEEGFW